GRAVRTPWSFARSPALAPRGPARLCRARRRGACRVAGTGPRRAPGRRPGRAEAARQAAVVGLWHGEPGRAGADRGFPARVPRRAARDRAGVRRRQAADRRCLRERPRSPLARSPRDRRLGLPRGADPPRRPDRARRLRHRPLLRVGPCGGVVRRPALRNPGEHGPPRPLRQPRRARRDRRRPRHHRHRELGPSQRARCPAGQARRRPDPALGLRPQGLVGLLLPLGCRQRRQLHERRGGRGHLRRSEDRRGTGMGRQGLRRPGWLPGVRGVQDHLSGGRAVRPRSGCDDDVRELDAGHHRPRRPGAPVRRPAGAAARGRRRIRQLHRRPRLVHSAGRPEPGGRLGLHQAHAHRRELARCRQRRQGAAQGRRAAVHPVADRQQDGRSGPARAGLRADRGQVRRRGAPLPRGPGGQPNPRDHRFPGSHAPEPGPRERRHPAGAAQAEGACPGAGGRRRVRPERARSAL
ncbi:MAG: hypothetical protein AVDCRST_MAG19-6, partial [uncultured Thermomicrobiales bacterium]